MKIIFFASHTATWHFALAEATLAHALKTSKNEVLFVTSGGVFKGGMSSRINENILRKEFELPGYDIVSKLTRQDRKRISSILLKITKNNFKKLRINNVQIGKIALYEFLLNHKKMSTDLSNKEWAECLVYIKNTLISFFAARRIIQQEKPDRLLMYNTLYSVNHVWERVGAYKKVPVYFIHHGLNLSDMDNTLIVAKYNMLFYIDSVKKLWKNYRDKPINQEMVNYVMAHYSALLSAKHVLVYSSPKSKKRIDIYKSFGINKRQKIILATMSSYDEMFAAQFVGGRKNIKNLIFKDQVEWIKSLITYFKDRKDLFLIIRVHPREFPNKRESVKSEHAVRLEKTLIDLPTNVKVNWPGDNISIYDLAGSVDVILNAWSTVGLEMSLLGLPVVTYARELISYPEDLNFIATSKKDYFNKIEIALSKGLNFETAMKACRWLALFYCRPIIRIREKPENLGSEESIKPNFSIINYLFNKLSPEFRSYVANKGRLRQDCRDAISRNVDVSQVVVMLRNKADNLIMDIEGKNIYSKKSDEKLLREKFKSLKNIL